MTGFATESIKYESFCVFFCGLKNKKIKKIKIKLWKKFPDFCDFLIFLNFLKIIFEKSLDFSELRTHNKRAFKLKPYR